MHALLFSNNFPVHRTGYRLVIIIMLTLMNGISTHFNQSKKWTQKRIQTHSHLILTKKSIVSLIFFKELTKYKNDYQ